VVVGSCAESLEGRDVAGGCPAVPPSLTAARPGGRSAARSICLRPVLLSRSARHGRCVRAVLPAAPGWSGPPG